jgi:predicted CXXCH cytochrome family protein
MKGRRGHHEPANLGKRHVITLRSHKMKRQILMAGVGAAAVGFIAAVSFADIANTAHNFSGSAWGGGEICKPCHTPHFADESIGYLWAHELSAEVYTLFDGSVSAPGGADKLDVHSRQCLSCHDGTVALNSYHNGNGQDFFISDTNKVGGNGNLADDHPIGTAGEYDVAGAPGRFNAATLSPGGWGCFGPGYFPEIPLFDFDPGSGVIQVVSCSTCHDPHGETGVLKLLRKDNGGSDLCLTCHIK